MNHQIISGLQAEIVEHKQGLEQLTLQVKAKKEEIKRCEKTLRDYVGQKKERNARSTKPETAAGPAQPMAAMKGVTS